MTAALRPHYFLYVVLMAAGLEIPATSVAGEPNLHAGEYIMEGGNGRLSLEEGEGRRFSFSIDAVGQTTTPVVWMERLKRTKPVWLELSKEGLAS